MALPSVRTPHTVDQLYDLSLGDNVRRALTLHQCVGEALRFAIEKLHYTSDRIAAECGGLLRRFEGDLSLNEIVWRCWVAGERFSGNETDVLRMRRHCYAILMRAARSAPAGDLDTARHAVLERIGVNVAPSDAVSSPSESHWAHTGLPAPLHIAAEPGSRARDNLSADVLATFERIAAVAADRPGALPGFETLSVSLDLPSSVPRARGFLRESGIRTVAHVARLIAMYEKMAGGEVVTPAQEVASVLADFPGRWRRVARHRLGIETGTLEGLEAAAMTIGVTRERARQIMVQVADACEHHPLPLPICAAAWGAFPEGRVAVLLEDWWRSLPEPIRPAHARELSVLQHPGEWHWIPPSVWVPFGDTCIVALEPLTHAAVEAQIAIVADALRGYRHWGAVSLHELTGPVEAHPDVIRASLAYDARWVHVQDDWYIALDARSLLARKVGRWSSSTRRVRAAAMRRALAMIVRRRQAAGKPGSIPPTFVLRALRAYVPARARPPADTAGAPSQALPVLRLQPSALTPVTMPSHEVKSGFDLNGSQAQYVVDRLLRDGRLTVADVTMYLSEMQREIEELETRLRVLRAASGQSAAVAEPREASHASVSVASHVVPERAVPRRSHPRADMSPETLASRQLQGRYLGLIRKIPDERRAEFRRIAAEQGRVAAIEALRAELGTREAPPVS